MSGPAGPERRWDRLSADARREEAARSAVVVVPLAATEQHGPHLPLSTDVDIGRGILEAALERLRASDAVYHLPFRDVGVSLEHQGWPGTRTVSARELEDDLVAAGAALAREGIRRLVLFNSHGGNKAVLDTAALRLRVEEGMLVVKANYFRFRRPPAFELPESEWEHGLHGGAVETAMMLHLHPDRVERSAIRRFPSLGEALARSRSLIRPEGAAPFAWVAADLNPEGVTGDATLADAAMGRRLVAHYADLLSQVVRDALSFPLDALADHGA